MVKQRLRVLQVVADLEAGGLERLVADMVRRLDSDRFESHILALGFLGRYAEGLEQHAVLHVGARSGPWSLVWPGRLIRQLRGIAPDIVHSHSGVWYKATLAARHAGVPVTIHTDHGRLLPDRWSDRMMDRLAARRTDCVVAVSEVLGRYLATRVVGDSSRIRVVINGVDTETFRPRSDGSGLRAELGIAPDVPIIGSLGRLDHIKGYDVMVESFAALLQAGVPGPAPVLLIAGDGPDRPAIEGLITARGLADRARVLGWRRDVHEFLAALTLFTLTSRSEGTSVSLMEAMSSGVCPVVTRVGGNADVLGPELAHRMAPSESPERIAQAWRVALTDPVARMRDAEYARTRVQRGYSLDRMVADYAQLYEEYSERRYSKGK